MCMRCIELTRRSLLVGGGAYDDEAAWPSLPDGARWAIDLVEAPEALALGWQEGYVRVFVDEGQPMGTLFGRLATVPPAAPAS